MRKNKVYEVCRVSLEIIRVFDKNVRGKAGNCDRLEINYTATREFHQTPLFFVYKFSYCEGANLISGRVIMGP